MVSADVATRMAHTPWMLSHVTVSKEGADPLKYSVSFPVPVPSIPASLFSFSFFFFKLHSNSQKSNVCCNLVICLKDALHHRFSCCCNPGLQVKWQKSASKSKSASPPSQWHRGEIFPQEWRRRNFGPTESNLCIYVVYPSPDPQLGGVFLFVCSLHSLTVDFCEGGGFSCSFLRNNKINHWNWEIDLLPRINRWGYWLFSDLELLFKNVFFFQGVVVLFSFSIAFELPPTEVKKETTAIQACWLSYKRTSFKLVYTTDSKWIQDGG